MIEHRSVYLFTSAYHHRKLIPLLSYKISYMAGSSKNPQGLSQEPSPPRAADEVVQRWVLGSDLPSSPDPPIRHGGGKGLMRAPPRGDCHLHGQMREPRGENDSKKDSKATTSGRTNHIREEKEEERNFGGEDHEEEQEVKEELEEVEPPKKKARRTKEASFSKASKLPQKKKELDPIEPRPRHPNNNDFQESTRLISKVDVRVSGYLDSFYLALVPEILIWMMPHYEFRRDV